MAIQALNFIDDFRDSNLSRTSPVCAILESWASRLVFLKAAYEFPLGGHEEKLFRECARQRIAPDARAFAAFACVGSCLVSRHPAGAPPRGFRSDFPKRRPPGPVKDPPWRPRLPIRRAGAAIRFPTGGDEQDGRPPDPSSVAGQRPIRSSRAGRTPTPCTPCGEAARWAVTAWITRWITTRTTGKSSR